MICYTLDNPITTLKILCDQNSTTIPVLNKQNAENSKPII